MYALLISLCCSVAVSVLLKLARRQQIDIAQAITWNYAVAAGFTLLLLQPSPQQLLPTQLGGTFWVMMALGVLLPSVFIIMAKAVAHAGIALSDAAQRLSLLIPLIAAATLFNEPLTGNRLAGAGVALMALLCLSIGNLKRQRHNTNTTAPYALSLWLLGVWLGYGVIDILFKQLAKSGISTASGLLGSFILAGLWLGLGLSIKKTQWQWRNTWAGLLLGVLNFGNIYFYIRAHQLFPHNPSLVFTTMNIGVISVGTLVGIALFNERLHRVGLLGLLLAVVAVWLLFPR